MEDTVAVPSRPIVSTPRPLARRLALGAAAAVLCLPGEAQANMGVPMIFLTLPGMALALVPVVFLEMWVLAGRLGIPARLAFKVSAWANVFTTFVGIPATWLALTILEMATGGGGASNLNSPLNRLLVVTWQAPWMGPNVADGNHDWMIPAATAWLLVPFFFASWWLEFKVAARILPDRDRGDLKSAMLWANLFSYSLLELGALGWLAASILSAP